MFKWFWTIFSLGAPDVSQVAGERVEYIKKVYVVAEEIKEVELRSRRAQFIYDRN